VIQTHYCNRSQVRVWTSQKGQQHFATALICLDKLHKSLATNIIIRLTQHFEPLVRAFPMIHRCSRRRSSTPK